MFEPANKLEALMQAAVKNPAVIPDFYKTLMQSQIYILTPEADLQPGRSRSLKHQEPLNVATVDYQGLKWHPAFTSRKRISDYVKEPETCFGAMAHHVFGLLPGSNFWLNPQSECQKPLPASEVALLLSGEIFEVLKAAR